jgi:hypothetical protein
VVVRASADPNFLTSILNSKFPELGVVEVLVAEAAAFSAARGTDGHVLLGLKFSKSGLFDAREQGFSIIMPSFISCPSSNVRSLVGPSRMGMTVRTDYMHAYTIIIDARMCYSQPPRKWTIMI